MITKYVVAKGIILSFYFLLLSIFILINRQELNNILSNDYILMKNVKIDSIYTASHSGNRNGDSHYINFKDSGKKINLLLTENTLVQKQILTNIFYEHTGTIDIVKREKTKSYLPQNTVYFTYDDRFICNVNGKCNFTETYKNKVSNYLIWGALIFAGISYCTYRVYNCRIIESLKGQKFQFKFLDSFKD
ncbi:hypothetical protein SAMN05192550_0878 [Flavobacterium glycines]|uniref:Uncharacterized protein n=2 Tax=Flavobacterium glycines TaxID=551990 RepID=A0A1B9DSD6_9FLAO|nr:hypothetical protein FBGL_08160 [Flavobacterium glycines]GEL10099.1 hypothetical protein FGL01_08380 [Flavobacterium glycines]SDI81514.1 hypothetical protein SAMN05192550_0878 [Flavobacterium glycines]